MDDHILTYLRPDGTLEESDNVPVIPPEDLLSLYRTMLLNRRVDERMITLQRQGRIGFYIGSIGEEASVLGSAYALNPTEWIVPCYRELGAALWRGFPLYDLFCQLFGNADDPIRGRQMPNHYALPHLRFGSISSPVGTQIPQATGMAMAARLRGKKQSVLVYFGDGATSQGDFHVGLNFAGVYNAPVIFFCRNNQWAISVPFSGQTASKNIAIKAQAYGIRGLRVDGNDVFAVVGATREAANRARNGEGPTLIESVTYRVTGHSTSDDPRAYREDAEVEAWEKKDPILRLRRYMTAQGVWSDEQDSKLDDELKETIMSELRRAEKVGPPPVESLFEDVLDEVPWHLQEQRRELEEVLAEQTVEEEVVEN